VAGKKILTVCSANINRSTTTAFLLKLTNHKNEVWSRGSNRIACKIHGGTYCLNSDVQEADEIICMEQRNRKELLNAYGSSIDKKIKVLGIKDEYKAFSSDLVMEIFTKLE
jgi:protein-tyrosine-phosphatase